MTLLYSTYLGGGADESGRSIAVDTFGNAYVTGDTDSLDFPTPSGYDPTINGNRDAFVSKLSSDGLTLLYSTYLGGGKWEYGFGIAVDGSGNAYVTGWTSSKYDFPIPSGYDTTYNGDLDVFITKLSWDGPPPQPIPDIKANHSNGPITISRSDTLSVTVSLNANGRTDNANWWLVAETPFGWYKYDVYSNSWKPGQSASYQGRLFDLSPMEVLNMSGLPAGTYTFYFGVAPAMDSEVKWDSLVYDNVVVNVIE